MNIYHKNLAGGKWKKLSFIEQMANISSEIGRAVNLKNNDKKLSREAFERALELLDLTIEDPKNKNKLKELCLLREMLSDHFYFNNQYNSTDEQWNDYFYNFAYAAAVQRESANI